MTISGHKITWKDEYRGATSRVRTHGRSAASTPEVRAYLRARCRAHHQRGTPRTQLSEYVEGLATTGFSPIRLAELAALPEPEPQDWEVGESLAEVLLADLEGAVFHWSTQWDRRSATAIQTGPDIVGFQRTDAGVRFLFGEVKTSADKSIPPQVVYGNEGLRNQLVELLTKSERRAYLMQWLQTRARGTSHEADYRAALVAYLSPQSVATIVGVLLRECAADSQDLSYVEDRVRKCPGSFDVLLLAFYLPIPVATWPAVMLGKDGPP